MTAPARPLIMPRPLRSAAITACCQVIGLAPGIALRNSLSTSALPDAAVVALYLGVHCGVAALIARVCRLSPAWQIVNLLIPIGAAAAVMAELPFMSVVLLALIGVLTYLPAFGSQVPYFPSARTSYDAVLAYIPAGRSVHFIDLGCGFGGMLQYLAAHRPGAEFHGVELAPLPWLITRIRSLFAPNLHASLSSLWSVDLQKFDIVYCFLAPPPMPQVWEKIRRELRPGSIFISNSFPAPHPEDERIELPGVSAQSLYIYRIP